MVAVSRSDVPSKPALSSFARMFNEVRARSGAPSRYNIADHCGVSISTVNSWGDGSGLPTVQQFKRLCGMFHRLIATPPTWQPPPPGTIADKLFQSVKDAAAEANKPAPKPSPSNAAVIAIPEVKPPEKPLEKFGDAIRRLRGDMNHAKFGKLIGTGPSAIYNWEAHLNGPGPAAYAALVELLPELKAGCDNGTIEKPRLDPRGRGRPLEKDKPKIVESIRAPEPTPTPTQPPLLDIAPVAQLRAITDVDALAVTYGRARAAVATARREREALADQLVAMDKRIAELKQQADAAEAALNQAFA